MNNNHLPKAEAELENWMKENCFNFNSYSINGNMICEGFGIATSENLFVWYYTERGQREILQSFKSESEIIAFAFHQINVDMWAKTHCIGFSEDKDKIIELENLLKQMNIEFFEDKIPYYGIKRPVYRVFVLGCNIKKTEYLKEKYCIKK